MDLFVERHSAVWGDDPRSLLANYRYQPELTARLDRLNPDEFGIAVLHEIVLWKLNRYPTIDAALVDDLGSAATMAPGDHRQAEHLLKRLLWCPGVALPMASTILRFLRPRTFQIIDDRAFRVMYPGKRGYPPKPPGGSERYANRCTEMYFQYLDDLHLICSERLPFEHADRILYLLDIALGHKIGSATED